MTIKALLKMTIFYTIYRLLVDWEVQYIRYPSIMRKAGVDNTYPKESGICSNPVFRDKKLIISLTSFPARIPYVSETIISIMHQSIKPNMIILWLSKKQFPQQEKDLSGALLSLKKFGLDIRWLDDDIRSYKKLIPALIDFPDDVIVTTDDDVYYPTWWLKRLIDSFTEFPDAIHAHASTRVDLNGDKIVFKKRYGIDGDGSITNHNKLTGVGGVLYPPKILHQDVTDKQKFMQLAPTNDDIWFWSMALVNDKKVCWIKENMKRPLFVYGSQENSECLCNVNDKGERLIEKQTQAVFESYNLFDKLR